MLSRDKKARHTLSLQAGKAPLCDVVKHTARNIISRDGDVFCSNGHLSEGIIVLINDVDADVLAQDAPVSAGDKVTFISMVHGG